MTHVIDTKELNVEFYQQLCLLYYVWCLLPIHGYDRSDSVDIHIYRKKHRPITTPWELQPESSIIYQNSIKRLWESIRIGVR